MYIHRLTNEYSGLYYSVLSTFLGLGTEEFSSVIFLSLEEYKNIEKDTLFSYSVWRDNIHTKMNVHVASELHFGCFTYAQKYNEITFPMQLVSCQNSSEINRNHQNNILTVAMGMMTSPHCCYYDMVTFILKWMT
jgi:hypothetical protein